MASRVADRLANTHITGSTASHPKATSWSQAQQSAVAQIETMFDIPTERAKQIVQRFTEEFTEGLAEEGKDMAMIPTYVTGVPNGSETGTFLALDLGGTNLRVCQVTLLGGGKFTLQQSKYTVSEALKTGDVRNLFDYIAQCIDSFVTEHDTEKDDREAGPPNELHLGFTFSFPVLQTALDRGKLLTWTKGFKCTNAIGKDVVQLLQDALTRKHLNIRCSALVNDTVGTLMARAYASGDALVGCIFGTGTNAAYVEDLSKVKKLGSTSGASKMVINTEWGAFDNARRVLPITMFDNKVDRESINPRKQAFEKQVSGMYQGEVARNVILYLIDLGVLFGGLSSPELNSHYGFDTAYMSTLEADRDPGSASSPTAKLLETLNIAPENQTPADREILQAVCQIVGKRAAKLSACALAAIATHTGFASISDAEQTSHKIDAGIDGTVFEHYPHFKDRMLDAMRDILGASAVSHMDVGIAKDGSGVGAALCALQAKKQEEAGVRLGS